MSKTTGAPAPTQPINPFIDPNDAESTALGIRTCIAVVQQLIIAEQEGDSQVAQYDLVQHGMIVLLSEARDGVKLLSHMEAVPTVTQLEARR